MALRAFVALVSLITPLFSLQSVESDEVHVVKNMPSFSPKFRGFDFKLHFRPIFPNAKISAIADRARAPQTADWTNPAQWVVLSACDCGLSFSPKVACPSTASTEKSTP